MPKTLTVLLLSLVLRGCGSQGTQPQQQTPPTTSPKAPDENASGKSQGAEGAVVLHGDEAEIMVFPVCGGSIDRPTGRREYCPIKVVYELRRSLSEGSLQVFDELTVEAEYPLPELSAGKHITTLPHSFYWPARGNTLPEENLPDHMIWFSVGTVPTSLWDRDLWENDSGHSAYDYKPGPRGENVGDPPPDEAAPFRGNDVGFSSMNIPAKHNQELLDTGDLPEIEILGVGFDNGTNVQFWKQNDRNPNREYPTPLRDVRVVSTASHDEYDAIPVLKAGRFTVPKAIFEYPSHIRIVGKLR